MGHDNVAFFFPGRGRTYLLPDYYRTTTTSFLESIIEGFRDTLSIRRVYGEPNGGPSGKTSLE